VITSESPDCEGFKSIVETLITDVVVEAEVEPLDDTIPHITE